MAEDVDGQGSVGVHWRDRKAQIISRADETAKLAFARQKLPVELGNWVEIGRLSLGDKFKFSDNPGSHTYQVTGEHKTKAPHRDDETVDSRTFITYENLKNGNRSQTVDDRRVLVVDVYGIKLAHRDLIDASVRRLLNVR